VNSGYETIVRTATVGWNCSYFSEMNKNIIYELTYHIKITDTELSNTCQIYKRLND
jgi:hypothetical protein